MDKAKYDEFYNVVIKGLVNDLLKIDKDYNCLNFNDSKKYKVYRHYEIMRQRVRSSFMELESKPMDRHKIAATMMYAILKSNLIKISRARVKLPNQLFLANQYLAFYAAMNILDLYRLNDNKNSKRIILPPLCNESVNIKDDYVSMTCKALYYTKNINRFDLFSYANILFLLETYTDCIS